MVYATRGCVIGTRTSITAAKADCLLVIRKECQKEVHPVRADGARVVSQ